MHRSFDKELLLRAVVSCPTWDHETFFDAEAWLGNDRNLMLVENDDVGLLSYEYEGLYNAHWFYNCRGKEARDLAKKMLGYCFEIHDAQAIRGITPMELKGARWLAKQLGFKSLGEVYPEGKPHELMLLTKKDYEELNGS